MDGFGLLVVLVLLAVAGGSAVYEHLRRQRKHRDLQRLLERDPRLQVTVTPCGLDREALAVGYEACPRGDRNRGVRYGVSGLTTIEVAGQQVEVECAAFQWFWEVASTERRHGVRRTRYQELRQTVAAVQLPVDIWRRILITPESALGRTGLTRGGLQVESDAFNRRFRIASADRSLAVQLLDARMQQLLLEAFTGRTIELRGTTMLLAGKPTHRDDSLTGVVGELPAVRQDVRRLLLAVPAQFWRAAGAP